MRQSVLVEEAGGVLHLTIDRQPRLNAIDLAAMTELGDLIRAAADRPSVRVIVLTELDAALAREKDGQIELLTSADFLEGMTAMLTRRTPNFTGAVHPVAAPA
ncbi:hypothetical protein [Nocardia salmonicida]|uniref:hypothetical protein n=1 Tax=Nocardia salmonicida TaxID=53431 RepID=UPI0037BC3C4F